MRKFRYPPVQLPSFFQIRQLLLLLLLFVLVSTAYMVVSSLTRWTDQRPTTDYCRRCSLREKLRTLILPPDVAPNDPERSQQLKGGGLLKVIFQKSRKELLPPKMKLDNDRDASVPKNPTAGKLLNSAEDGVVQNGPKRNEQKPSESKSGSAKDDKSRQDDHIRYLKKKAKVVDKPRIFTKQENEAMQAKRQKHIQRVCDEIYQIPAMDLNLQSTLPLDRSLNPMMDNTFINDDYNLTVTVVRKVGSSNWRTFMWNLYSMGSWEFKTRWRPVKTMHERRPKDTRYVLKRYTKILFVRNPFVRLLSAYRDRFGVLSSPMKKSQSDNTTRWNLQKANLILTQVRMGKPHNPFHPDMTFAEFLRYIADVKGKDGDPFWTPVFQTYKPCEVRYDFIGKLETVSRDTKYLIEKFGLKGRIEYGYPTPYSGSSVKSVLIKFYSQIPGKLAEEIFDIYKDDFITFDYSIPDNFSKLAAFFETH